MRKTTLVTQPEHMNSDPGKLPWTARLKYTDPAELLLEYQLNNAAIGRRVCPATDYIAAHLDDDIVDIENYLWSHEEWGPWVLCDTIAWTTRANNADTHEHGELIAKAVQHYAALHLVKLHPFARARPAVSTMLYSPKMRFVSPEARELVLDFITAGHPSPSRWLDKPEISAKFAAVPA